MRLLLIALTALMLLAAGCANNRNAALDEAPSSQAAASDAGAGWSVPPGQKTVTDPAAPGSDASAGQGAAATHEAPDEAALAEAERQEREASASKAREELQLQPQRPAVAQRPAQPIVPPLVPAFPERAAVERVAALRTIHFQFEQWDLTEQTRAVLSENANWMKANPEQVIQVGGHADERGTPEYNLALGEKRARRVREYLIEQGVPADNLVTASYGEEMPLEAAHDETAWSVNRRAQFNRADGRQVSGEEPQAPSS